ncbi:MAG: SPOR domain-containing protein [Bacteroidetes bacterium]|nr:SPOR domain-containing protein [Bacteroidota bacterium]
MKRLPLYSLLVQAVAVLLFSGPAATGYAQENTKGKGQIQIVQDERVDLLVSKHVQINQNRNGMEGYRIQIFFDSGNNSKTKAQSINEGFKAKYPDVGAYLSFKSPNYKVRVGDFRTRLDAQRFLNEIIDEYPNAWIIADRINLPKVE